MCWCVIGCYDGGVIGVGMFVCDWWVVGGNVWLVLDIFCYVVGGCFYFIVCLLLVECCVDDNGVNKIVLFVVVDGQVVVFCYDCLFVCIGYVYWYQCGWDVLFIECCVVIVCGGGVVDDFLVDCFICCYYVYWMLF